MNLECLIEEKRLLEEKYKGILSTRFKINANETKIQIDSITKKILSITGHKADG
jgi:hypothetical protein